MTPRKLKPAAKPAPPRIAVCIPSVPGRVKLLERALASVHAQTLTPYEIVVAVDFDQLGASSTRNRAWRMATAPWVAFLDDDDELLPNHLEVLLAAALKHNGDVVHSRYEMRTEDLDLEGSDIDDEAREVLRRYNGFVLGSPWTPKTKGHPQVTCLWRRDALVAIEGFIGSGVEDISAFDALYERGGLNVYEPTCTWIYHRHDLSTGGDPNLIGTDATFAERLCSDPQFGRMRASHRAVNAVAQIEKDRQLAMTNGRNGKDNHR